MATRALTISTNRPERLVAVTAAALAASDDTAVLNVTKYNKVEAVALTAGFDSGNITITAQASQDGTNWLTLGTAATVTGNGVAYVLSGATAVQDITTRRFLRFIRGADANAGTVNIQLTCGNSPVNLN